MIRSTRTLPLLTAAFVVLTALGSAPSVGQERVSTGNSAFEPEELVEIQVFGDWVLGQIVKETAEESGSFRVKFYHDGKPLQRTYPQSKIRRFGESPLFPLSALRNWSDVSGKHSVHARLLEVTDGNIAVLLKQDGKQVDVPLDKLAAADRVYARKLAVQAKEKEEQESTSWNADRRVAGGRRNRRAGSRSQEGTHGGGDVGDNGDAGGHGGHGAPAPAVHDGDLAAMLGADEPDDATGHGTETHGAPAENAPPEGDAGPLGGLTGLGSELFPGGPGGENAPDGTPATQEISSANARTIEIDANQTWELVPEPANATAWDDLVVDLPAFPSAADGNVIAMSLAVARDGRRAIGLFERDGGDSVVALATIDSESSTSSANVLSTTDLHRVLDLSPDGQRVFGVSQSESGESTLGIWSLQGDSVVRQVSLHAPGWTTIHRATWFDDSHVLVFVDDQVAMVQIDPVASASVQYIVPGATGMAVTPTRTHLAVQRVDGIALLNAATGVPVGWIPFATGPPTAMAIAPDGLYLATASVEGLAYYELESGMQAVLAEMTKDIHRLDWVTSDYVVVNGAGLFRFGNQKTVRSYEFQSPMIASTMQTANGAFWFLVPSGPQVPAQLVRLGLIPTEFEARAKDPVIEWSLGRNGKTPLRDAGDGS